jgi:hypothetical protein
MSDGIHPDSPLGRLLKLPPRAPEPPSPEEIKQKEFWEKLHKADARVGNAVIGGLLVGPLGFITGLFMDEL